MSCKVMSRKKMIDELHYPRSLLDKISHDENCTHLFFRNGNGRTSNIYYYPEKVERWLEMREDERMMERKK